MRKLILVFGMIFFSFMAMSQNYFNAWLTTCAHLIGPTGNPQSLKLAVDQSRGLYQNAPGFKWDILVDVGDWTASQKPPEDEEGVLLARCLNETLGSEDRGRFFTVSGNHDGDARGWTPGEFAQKYVNPLGDPKFVETSGFDLNQRLKEKDYHQILDYPGTRWDRYLIRTGNVIWIMLGDRNEYDGLAESRGDFSGQYQAGRGSAMGMPKGGYPSGAVTLDTYQWWKRVVEDPKFSNDILITSHHLMPANTTITTDDGEPGGYHGDSGSKGPKGEIGGQLYWIREYNDNGEEVRQYAQTRPFLNYLRDHPGAIAAWVGGHTHINTPGSKINSQGLYVRKYGVSFLSIGALTNTHGGGENQMSRMLSFENGKNEAIVHVYIHKSNTNYPIGWQKEAARKIPLGKIFHCPDNSSNEEIIKDLDNIRSIPNSENVEINPRYYWNLNRDKKYDFNNNTHVVGEDGSPYGVFRNVKENIYSKGNQSLNFNETEGYVEFSAPFSPELNWDKMTLSLWLKTNSTSHQEVINYTSRNKVGKFQLKYDGKAWVWAVGDGSAWMKAKWESDIVNQGNKWHHFVAVVDGSKNLIQLYVDNKLMAEEKWNGGKLNPKNESTLVVGNIKVDPLDNMQPTGNISYKGQIDEIMIFDRVISTDEIKNKYYDR